MDFVCKRCSYTTCKKCHLVRHLQNKNLCKPILSNISAEDLLFELKPKKQIKYYKCENCDKQFNSRSTRYRHQQNCKIFDIHDEVLKLKQEIEELKSNQLKLTHQTPSIINSGTINNTNNITVNNFGQENIEYLMKRLEYYWHNKAHGLIEMTKDIHFDPQHPENHTFTITNQRAKIAKIRENGEWVPKSCEEAIDDIVYSVSKEIEQFIEEKTEYLKNKFPRVVDLTNNWWEKIGTEAFDEKEYKNLVRRLVEMVVIHRRNITKI